MKELRCKKCHKLLGKYDILGVLEIKCPKCKALNEIVEVKK